MEAGQRQPSEAVKYAYAAAKQAAAEEDARIQETREEQERERAEAASKSKNPRKKPESHRQQLWDSVRSNVKLNKFAMKIMEMLMAPGVPKSALKRSALVLRPVHYEEVLEERVNSNLCGYPTCSASLEKQTGKLPSFRLSMKEKRVYDVSSGGVYNYCSRECFVASELYKASLSDDPASMRPFSRRDLVPATEPETAAKNRTAAPQKAAAMQHGGEASRKPGQGAPKPSTQAKKEAKPKGRVKASDEEEEKAILENSDPAPPSLDFDAQAASIEGYTPGGKPTLACVAKAAPRAAWPNKDAANAECLDTAAPFAASPAAQLASKRERGGKGEKSKRKKSACKSSKAGKSGNLGESGSKAGQEGQKGPEAAANKAGVVGPPAVKNPSLRLTTAQIKAMHDRLSPFARVVEALVDWTTVETAYWVAARRYSPPSEEVKDENKDEEEDEYGTQFSEPELESLAASRQQALKMKILQQMPVLYSYLSTVSQSLHSQVGALLRTFCFQRPVPAFSRQQWVFTAAVMLKTVTARQLASANSETLRALSAQLPFPAYDDPSLIKLMEGLGFSVDHFKSAFITISTDYYD